jgi:hypothetical protein
MIRTTLAAKERSLARRKAALGITGRNFVAPNSGERRTASKRQLLRTIEQEARARGAEPRFEAAIG